MSYKRLNTIFGWLIFVVAAVTYCLTIEPTASFWDCPEFITTGYKMEVGHPPGAPIFMLTANLFSQFVDDPSKVAMMVNIMSALLSAACILFLFWSITHLTKKLIAGKEDPTLWQTITILGSGIVGALAYTWSDTFWYSAVEGEVYAYSSLCTAVTFWLILKWEENYDQPHSTRWLVLIAYLIGVSVGVHLLNLLCIVAIVLVYYFKTSEKPTVWGSLVAVGVSALIIAAILYGIVPGIVKVGGWFELLFVNGMGFSFNSGLIVYIILFIAALLWSVYETQKGTREWAINTSFLLTIALTGMPFIGHKASGVIMGILLLGIIAFYLFSNIIPEKFKPSQWLMNTLMLCIMTITIGYSSYAVIVIRSTANPPMDQDSPEDIFSLGEYLAREQYGDRPLLYGQAYSSKVAYDVRDEACYPKYDVTGKSYGRKEKTSENEKDSYYVMDEKRSYIYAQNMVFPRMYSSESRHIGEYNHWVGGIKGKKVPYDNCGQMVTVTVPTQLENLKFFFRYQVGFMYWRYFMWNFVGRQNDIQGHGEIENGNWITGINFIDNKLVGGDQRILPEAYKGKGRNVFYGLPLILGIIGLCWQLGKGKKGTQQFWVVFSLFFMTGLAIVVYLNQTPLQPRERDYAYAGSFYAFAIWIGMGTAAISEMLRKVLGEKAAPILAFAVTLLVPIQMIGQTWDDHDRSGRYTCRDFGQNYLKTLPEEGNPIIFTHGDNDTFPLWYNLDTEGFRTDTRVCNLSYLQTDWYIDQMKRPAYESPALPISFERKDYQTGTNDYVYVRPENKQVLLKNAKTEAERERVINSFELNNVLNYWIKEYHMVPTDTIWFELDKDAILRSGMFIPYEYRGATDEETKALMPDRMYISLANKNVLMKNEIMMLSLIAGCNWERPLYMSVTVPSEMYLNLGGHFIQEGLAYRITPFNYKKLGYNARDGEGTVVDTEKMYKNLMTFNFGGLDADNLYLDETIRRMCYSHRRIYIQLAGEFIKQNDYNRAKVVLDKIEKEMPASTLPHDIICYSTEMAKMYYMLEDEKKATEILLPIATDYLSRLNWYLSLNNADIASCAMLFAEEATMLEEYVFPTLARTLDEETFVSTAQVYENMVKAFENRLNVTVKQLVKSRK